MESKEHEAEDDEDGPPPGWNTIIPQKKLPSSPPTIKAVTCGKSFTLLSKYFLPCPLSFPPAHKQNTHLSLPIFPGYIFLLYLIHSDRYFLSLQEVFEIK